MVTLSSDFEGGAHGTQITTGGAGLSYGPPAVHGAFSRKSTPPEGAIQFSRDIWMDVPPQQVSVYVIDGGRWEHLDGSPCPAGLNVPSREWVQVMIPLRCADGQEIRHAAGEPFWLADLPCR